MPDLTIRGFESAYLSELVVAYIFSSLIHVFESPDLRYKYSGTKYSKVKGMLFYKIYRDNDIMVTRNKWSNADFAVWLDLFQNSVNMLLNSNKLTFTLDIWDAGNSEESRSISELVTVSGK